MERCSQDGTGANERKEVGVNVWDAPPPGLLERLIKLDISIANLRLVNSKWCTKVNATVKSASVPGDRLSEPEVEHRVTVVFAKFPCIERIRGRYLKSMQPVVETFRDKLLHLEIHDCHCDHLELLPRLSKLETLEMWTRDSSQKDLTHFSTLTTLKKLALKPIFQYLVNVHALSCLTNLEKLSLQYCTIETLHFAEPLTKLVELHFQLLGNITVNFRAISALTNLTNLAIGNCPFGDNDAPSLSRMVNLRVLSLEDTNVRDVGFKYVSHLTELRFLTFHGAPITEAGLEPIACLRNLVDLTLSGIARNGTLERGLFLTHLIKLERFTIWARLKDDVVHLIASLGSLTFLSFYVDCVTNDSFLLLRSLDKLESFALVIYNAYVAMEIGPLFEWPCFPGLRRLSMNGFRWVDESLVHLTRLKNLEDLDFHCEHVADAGLLYLTKLTSLKKLEWHCKNVSNKCNEQILKEAMPSCEINGYFTYV